MKWCDKCLKERARELEICPDCGEVLADSVPDDVELVTDYEWTTVARSTGAVMGYLIKEAIKSAGIPVTSSGSAFETVITPDTKIRVPKRHHEDAMEIVNDMLAPNDEGLVCSNCGADVNEEDQACPSCCESFGVPENVIEGQADPEIDWVPVEEEIGFMFGLKLKEVLEDGGVKVIISAPSGMDETDTPMAKCSVRVPHDQFDHADKLVRDFVEGIQWVTVAESTGKVLGNVVIAELDAKGIPYLVKGAFFDTVQMYAAPDSKFKVPDFLFDDAKQIVDDLSALADSYLECSECGAEVSDEDKVCPECGANLEDGE